MAWGVGLAFWEFFVTPGGMDVYSATPPVGMGTGGCLLVVSPTLCDLRVSTVTSMDLGGTGVLSGVISRSLGGL